MISAGGDDLSGGETEPITDARFAMMMVQIKLRRSRDQRSKRDAIFPAGLTLRHPCARYGFGRLPPDAIGARELPR
jgi:hypothetical protein